MKGLAILNKITHYAMILSMANCFFMVIITILDIASRHLLRQPVPGVIELNEVLMVGIVFFGLGMAQREKSHIRAELFTSKMSDMWQNRMDLLALGLSMCFWVILLAQALPKAVDSFMTGEYREGLIKFPIWPARIALAAGILIMCLQLLADIYTTWTQKALPQKSTDIVER